MASAEQLLKELVALPSVNPAFLPDNHPHGGEQRVADYLVDLATKAGLDVDKQEVVDDRFNVIVRLSPMGQIKRRIVLAPHMDTVPVVDERQLTPEVKNGKLYGRGSCDTKGSVAVFLNALMALAAGERRPKSTEIVLAALVDEENAQGGSRVFATSGAPADLAIVGEPTRLKIVTAHKGDVWLGIHTLGKAAHGSRPELGSNAIHAMADVVEILQNDYAGKLKEQKHELLGHPTVNVGSIWGGVQPNIVPDRCDITVDRRTLPGESAKSVIKELKDLFNSKKIRANIAEMKGLDSPPMETDAENELVKQLMKEARQSKPEGVDFFCDAAILSQAGTPSVVFGPGDIAQAHTVDEWILVRQLTTAGSILKRFLDRQP
jgi:succinyl-diaminopimelate desuccinylase